MPVPQPRPRRAERLPALAAAALLCAAHGSSAQPRLIDPAEAIDAREVTRIFSQTPAASAGLPRTRDIRKAAAAGAPEQPVLALRVQFALGSAAIPAATLRQIDAIAVGLAALPGQPRIRIDGHTDASGPDAYNARLSLRRAQAVRDRLIAHGVRPGWLETRGLGRSALLNASDPLAAENRRVEFHRIS